VPTESPYKGRLFKREKCVRIVRVRRGYPVFSVRGAGGPNRRRLVLLFVPSWCLNPVAQLGSDDAARAQTHIVDNSAGTFAGRITGGDKSTPPPKATGKRKTPVLAVRAPGVCCLGET